MYEYTIPSTPRTSLEVRSRNSSPSGFVNQGNNNSGNSKQGTPTSQTFNLSVPRTNIMVGNYINLPIFNGYVLEDPVQHWFLCKVVWIVQQVQEEAIKKA